MDFAVRLQGTQRRAGALVVLAIDVGHAAGEVPQKVTEWHVRFLGHYWGATRRLIGCGGGRVLPVGLWCADGSPVAPVVNNSDAGFPLGDVDGLPNSPPYRKPLSGSRSRSRTDNIPYAGTRLAPIEVACLNGLPKITRNVAAGVERPFLRGGNYNAIPQLGQESKKGCMVDSEVAGAGAIDMMRQEEVAEQNGQGRRLSPTGSGLVTARQPGPENSRLSPRRASRAVP